MAASEPLLCIELLVGKLQADDLPSLDTTAINVQASCKRFGEGIGSSHKCACMHGQRKGAGPEGNAMNCWNGSSPGLVLAAERAGGP